MLEACLHLSCSLYPYTAKKDLYKLYTPINCTHPMVVKYDFFTIVAHIWRFESFSIKIPVLRVLANAKFKTFRLDGLNPIK